MKKNLTDGSVLKNVIFFSLPYLLSYFLQTLYGMADLYIIGQDEGAMSITAVSIGSQIMHMITVMIVGLAMGTTVNIAEAIGANDKKQTSKIIGNTIILFLAVAIIMMTILLLCVSQIVLVMSTPIESIEGTIQYLVICFIGIPFITAYNIISSIFRGMGDSKSPMYFIGIACITNIVLDYILIMIFHLGPIGAAFGTVVSQAISVLVSIFVIIKRKYIILTKNDFKPFYETIKKILYIGIPIALQDGLIQIAFIVITIIANLRGLNDAAAVGIVEKIISFLFLVPSSMLSTVSVLGAQNIGANKTKRAIETLRYAIFIAASFGIIVTIVIQIAAEQIVALFTNGDSIETLDVIRLGGQYLRGYVFDCIFAGIHFSFSGYFCACGKSQLSFLHNILAILLIRIPGAYLMSKMFSSTLFPMGIATAMGSLFSVIICIVLFIRKRKYLLTEN